MKDVKANFLAFKKGVLKAHEDYGGLDKRYASLFWVEIDGSMFESEEEAFAKGIEAVEITL